VIRWYFRFTRWRWSCHSRCCSSCCRLHREERYVRQHGGPCPADPCCHHPASHGSRRLEDHSSPVWGYFTGASHGKQKK